jgi:general stress protein 26
MKPEPQPVEANQLVELAQATMARAPFPSLASADGTQPRLRPISPVRTEGFQVYFASFRSSNKTVEIESNPAVELCYMDEGHDQVRITGSAQLIEDGAVRQSIWDANPLLRNFLGSIDNPEFLLYRVDPSRVRFMREWALEYHEVPIA